MKNIITLLLLFILTNVNAQSNYILNKKTIDTELKKTLEGGQLIYWDKQPTQILKSAIIQSGGKVSIGYQPKGFVDIDNRMHEFDLEKTEWKNALQKIYDTILKNETSPMGTRLTKAEVVKHTSPQLPFITVQINNPATIDALKELDEIRYIEPEEYSIELGQNENTTARVAETDPDPLISSPLGCENENPLPYINNNPDITVLNDGSLVSWHLGSNHVLKAWSVLDDIGYNKGDDIGAAIIDTGISDDQNYLVGPEFQSSCSSTSRGFARFSTLPKHAFTTNVESPHDKCGHGTRMAGLIGAPRSCSSPTTGIAYDCDIVGYRATRDVYIWGETEKKGVKNAIYAAANSPSINVISMSLGRLTSIGKIADAVKYAVNSKGKLMFCAAGTSANYTNNVFDLVVFPANMNETQAVTGIRENSSYDSYDKYQECTTCHYGDKVDFSVVVERGDIDQGWGYTLSRGIDNPSSTPVRVGGSSCATATMAGIATLVWGVNPSYTSTQVLDFIKAASAFDDTNRHPHFGYGWVNVKHAVINALPCNPSDTPNFTINSEICPGNATISAQADAGITNHYWTLYETSVPGSTAAADIIDANPLTTGIDPVVNLEGFSQNVNFSDYASLSGSKNYFIKHGIFNSCYGWQEKKIAVTFDPLPSTSFDYNIICSGDESYINLFYNSNNSDDHLWELFLYDINAGMPIDSDPNTTGVQPLYTDNTNSSVIGPIDETQYYKLVRKVMPSGCDDYISEFKWITPVTAITQGSYNSDTKTLSWSDVPHAQEYKVTVYLESNVCCGELTLPSYQPNVYYLMDNQLSLNRIGSGSLACFAYKIDVITCSGQLIEGTLKCQGRGKTIIKYEDWDYIPHGGRLTNKQDTKPLMTLAPNPAKSEVNILLDHAIEGLATINILSSIGKLVKQEVIDLNSNTKLDLVELPSGVYIVQVQFEGQAPIASKLILAK